MTVLYPGGYREARRFCSKVSAKVSHSFTLETFKNFLIPYSCFVLLGTHQWYLHALRADLAGELTLSMKGAVVPIYKELKTTFSFLSILFRRLCLFQDERFLMTRSSQCRSGAIRIQDYLCHVCEQQVLNRWSNVIRIIHYQRFTGRLPSAGSPGATLPT